MITLTLHPKVYYVEFQCQRPGDPHSFNVSDISKYYPFYEHVDGEDIDGTIILNTNGLDTRLEENYATVHRIITDDQDKQRTIYHDHEASC